MVNRAYYIQHKDSQGPAKIHSHLDTQLQARPLPLMDVADLIYQFQSLRNSPLALTFVGDISLHSILNGVEVTYNHRDTLDLMSVNVGTGTNPLIIRSVHDFITMNQHMLWNLPLPVYENCVDTPNTSGSSWKRPTHLFSWPDFGQTVVRWINSNTQQHSQTVTRPVFVDGIVITEEVQTLQPFIKLNLLDISAKCFLPLSSFKARRQNTSCIGEPDHLLTRNGKIVAIFEGKGKWSLPDGDLFGTYGTSRACASAVNQLYHYMRLNHCKYGILSTYEHTWFVYRSQQCSFCAGPDYHETLYVSDGVPYTDRAPNVMQCLSYFNSIVDDAPMASPPTSKRTSRANSASQTSRPTDSTVSSGDNIGRGGNQLLSDAEGSQQAQDFTVDDFRLDTLLGEGRSRVYLDVYNSKPIALKTADIAKHREMLPEMLNEVSIYEQLHELQGKGIPTFVCHGFVEDVLYCVGVSVCGVVPDTLNEEQKRKLEDVLDKIHQFGILHNDIKRENIVVDEFGNPYLIDFGFSARNDSVADQREERDILLQLIQSI
jgi:hypothetical protein